MNENSSFWEHFFGVPNFETSPFVETSESNGRVQFYWELTCTSFENLVLLQVTSKNWFHQHLQRQHAASRCWPPEKIQATKAIEPECVVASVCRGYVAYVVGVDFESDTIEKWQKDPEKRDLADLGFCTEEFDNGCWSKLNTDRLRHWWVLLVPDTEVLIQIVNTSHVGIHMELWRSVLPSLPARCILDVNGMTQQNADSWVQWMLPLVSSSHVAQGCWIDHRVSFRATKLVCFLVKSVEGGVSFVDPVSGHPRLLYGNHEEPPWPKCIQVFAHAIFIKVQ